MEEEARVIEVNGREARLEVEKSNACGSCHVCHEDRGGRMLISAENSLGAKEGDRVRIEINSYMVLKGSFLIYLMPIIGLILGAFLASQVTASEGMEVAGGIGGFIVSFILIYYYLRKTEPKDSFAARITKIFD